MIEYGASDFYIMDYKIELRLEKSLQLSREWIEVKQQEESDNYVL